MKRTLTTTLCMVSLFLTGVLLDPNRVSGSRMSAGPQQGRKPDRDKRNAPPPGTKMEGAAGISLVYIPAGKFQMGSKSGESDERPVHQVVISAPFHMGKYEVTQAQWESVMGKNPSHFKDCLQCPVESVSWDEVQDFIRKLNEGAEGFTYRLPTEAEWEYACRAGTTGDYAGDLDTMGWYGGNSGLKRTRSARNRRTPGGCTTCMGTSMNGVRMGAARIMTSRVFRVTRWDHRQPRPPFFAAVVGAAPRPSAGRRIATGVFQATGTTFSVSDS